MVSSTPADDAPAPPAPGLHHIDGIAAQAAAIDTLAGLARRTIRVFDVDLSGSGWNRPERAERLSTFVRGARDARLDIILHDTRWYESQCARLVALQRHFSTAITVRRTGAASAGMMDPLVIVDGRHYLHRFHIDHARAVLGIEHPQGAKPLLLRFDEIWAAGEPGVAGSVLGL